MKKIRFLNNDDVVYPNCELCNIHKDAFMYNYLMLEMGLRRPIPYSNDECFGYLYSCVFNLRRLKSLGFEGYEAFKTDFVEFLSYCVHYLPENCVRLYECFRWE